jgi:putative aldouronate transport system permease protein
MVIKKSAGRKIFMAFNNMIMVLLVVITAYPMLFILFASISKPNALLAHEGLLLAPLGFNLDSYAAVLKNPLILS